MLQLLSLMLCDVTSYCEVGAKALIQARDSNYMSLYPSLVKVIPRSEVVTGVVTIAVVTVCPFQVVDFLLADDLTEDKVLVSLVAEYPVAGQESEEEDFPRIFPSLCSDQSKD